MYNVFEVNFWEDGLMQEKTSSIRHHRTQNVWIEKSIYALKLLPKHIKQFAKCHALQNYVIFDNVEYLDVWWCLWISVCVCFVPRCAASPLRRLFGTFCLVCVWCTWSKSPRDATDMLSWPQGATLTSPHPT